MENVDPSVAQQIAQAAIAFQQQRTGHEPQSVAVVLRRRKPERTSVRLEKTAEASTGHWQREERRVP